MPNAAISAQGTTFEISGTTGAAKTITSVAIGFPTIITSAAHGLLNGDVTTLTGLTGANAASLNGQTVVIKNRTANTVAIDIDTTGQSITASGTVTPLVWTPINGIVSFTGFDGTAAELDTTNLQSKAKECVAGLQDWGQFQFDVNRDFGDAGQQSFDAAKRSSALKSFRLTMPNGKTKTFSAIVKNSPLAGGVDAILKTSGVSLRISGDVTDA